MEKLFGKTYDSVGSSDTDFLIKSRGLIRLLMGNKFIDLVKEGKLNVNFPKIFKTAENIEELENDGIYLVNDLLIIRILGTTIPVNLNNLNEYVSYINKLEDITDDLKLQALNNLGLYYKTISDYQANPVLFGIIFIEETAQAYMVLGGKSKALSDIFQSKLEALKNTEEFNSKLNDLRAFTEDLIKILDNYIKNIYNIIYSQGAVIGFTNNNIPEDWVICTGENGTPNLISKFIKAVPINANEMLQNPELAPEYDPNTIIINDVHYSLVYIVKI